MHGAGTHARAAVRVRLLVVGKVSAGWALLVRVVGLDYAGSLALVAWQVRVVAGLSNQHLWNGLLLSCLASLVGGDV